MSDTTTLVQTTQFSIKELHLILPGQSNRFDLSSVFQELNLFDNIFTPCVSGNILITDAYNLVEKFKFDGNEKIKIQIDKGSEATRAFRYEKEFVIYKMTNMKNLNLTSKSYILHFCSEEFILSEQKKISQNYNTSYSEAVETILNDFLKVPSESPRSGKAGIGVMYPTSGPKDFIIPTITPFDAINWITKRSVSTNYQTPSYVFYETAQMGYNFAPIDYLMELPSRFEINFKPKNLGDSVGEEFLGARDMKVLSNFSLLDNIRDGAYAGKFVGFDTLTKTLKISNVKTVYEKGATGSTVTNTLTDGYNKENQKYDKMYDSRIVVYPFATPRMSAAFIRENDPDRINFMDNTEDYVFQRKAIFSNLMQRRLQLMMPGNFGLYAGETVDLTVPKYSVNEGGRNYDKSFTGKYIITATRHIIKYDKHETLIEVSTDQIET